MWVFDLKCAIHYEVEPKVVADRVLESALKRKLVS